MLAGARLLPRRAVATSRRAATSASSSTAATMSRRARTTDKVHFNCHLKVLRTDLPNTCPSVMLLLEHSRYTFNCGESMQRLLAEHKMRLTQSDQYCFTRVSTQTMAGLPGVIMGTPVLAEATLQEQKPIKLTGPQGVKLYVDAFKTYAAMHPVSITEAGSTSAPGALLEPVVEVKELTIRPLVLTATRQSAAASLAEGEAAGALPVSEEGAGVDAEEAEPEAKRRRREGSAGAAEAQAPSTSTPKPALAYICELADRPGKFDPQKAANLGVPRGPLFGELQRGRAVEASTGRIVHPHEVMNPVSVPGPVVAIVDCPTVDYVPSLAGSPAWGHWAGEAASSSNGTAAQTGPAAGNGAAQDGSGGAGAGEEAQGGPEVPQKQLVVVHLTPWHVLTSAEYGSWMRQLPGSCVHIVADHPEALRGTMLRKSALFQAKLNIVDNDYFPLNPAITAGCQEPLPPTPSPLPAPPADPTAAPVAAILASDMFNYRIYPPKTAGPDSSEVPGKLDVVEEVANFRKERAELVQQIQEALAAGRAGGKEGQGGGEGDARSGDGEPPCSLARDEMEVTFLGTASAIPAAYRNVSGTWVDMFERGALMVDCGEDSYGQLIRRFGREEADAKVKKLQCVWISHMHADHHGGLYPLMTLRQTLLGHPCDPLLILGPPPLLYTLLQYNKVVPLHFAFVANDHLAGTSTRTPPDYCLERLQAVKAVLQLKTLTSFPVQHIRHSFGLQLESEAGWKVVFSGDTRPCDQVVEAAKGALLLVHEATFEDSLQEDAVAKMHSTFSEALGVAQKADVYRVILTHFSQRYPKFPGVLEQATGREAIAFDLMSVNLADLQRLPQMLRPVELLLAEESASMEAEAEEETGQATAQTG